MGRRSRCNAPRPPSLIVVDTSAWIDHFRDRRDARHVQTLRQAIFDDQPIMVGDIVLLELLLGVSTSIHAATVETRLRNFNVQSMLDDKLAVVAERNYRELRSRGVTLRGTVDLIIGTFCIERGYRLLHNDRDFEPMHALLGLRRA